MTKEAGKEREGYESRTYGSGMAADSEAELVAAITGRTSMSPEKRAEWEAQLSAMSATSEVFSGVGDSVLKSGEAPYHVSGEQLDLIRRREGEPSEFSIGARRVLQGAGELQVLHGWEADDETSVRIVAGTPPEPDMLTFETKYAGGRWQCRDEGDANRAAEILLEGFGRLLIERRAGTEGETLRVVESKVRP